MLGYDSADMVISTEMLEHAIAWRAAVTGMVQILAPGGLLLLTTRAEGFPFHPHPRDRRRFSVDQMGAIAAACGLDILRLEPDPDPEQPRRVPPRPQTSGGWDGTRMAVGLAAVEPGPPR